MQEACSVTTRSNMTIKRPSDTSETDRKPKLMDRLCEALRSRHYSRRTEQCRTSRCKRRGEFEGHHTEFVIPKFPVQLISRFLI